MPGTQHHPLRLRPGAAAPPGLAPSTALDLKPRDPPVWGPSRGAHRSSSSMSWPSLAQPTSGSGCPLMSAVSMTLEPTLALVLSGPFSILAGTGGARSPSGPAVPPLLGLA